MDELQGKQRNITFPDTVRNARGVDAFLWRGSDHPKLIQSIGAWLFGVTFLGFGVMILSFAKSDGWPLYTMLGAGFFFLGIRVFRNGFPRRREP